ncbi:MAG: NADH-quinone oxidoreductase subunit C [Candidatus Hadarchaeaceae archaeon]
MERVLRITPDTLKSISKELISEGFDHVKSLTGIDKPENGVIELVYHISSYLNPALRGRVVELRTEVDRSRPVITSILDVFPSCRYLELETRDLLGVKFEGNEEPNPLLLPEEMKDTWPLRKDYKIPEEGVE